MTAFKKESRKWGKLRKEFVDSVADPPEIHWFTCNHNAGISMKPLTQLVQNPACDAGTALRLFWLNDPVFYSQYATLAEAEGDERDAMRMLKAVKDRFKKGRFQNQLRLL